MSDDAQTPLNREAMAEVVHKARWPADRVMAITPFADEDRSGREYCFRIADAVLVATNERGAVAAKARKWDEGEHEDCLNCRCEPHERCAGTVVTSPEGK